MEIGGFVKRLWRYRPEDGYEVQIAIAVNGTNLEFEVATGCDDPAQAIEFARTWLVSFGTGLAEEFGEKGSLE